MFISSLSPFVLPILLTLVIAIVSFLILHRRGKKPQRNELPPSPPRLPIFGNLLQLGTLAHRSLHDLAAKYGDILLFHFGSVPTIIISSSSAAQEVLKTHDLITSSRPDSYVAEKLFYKSTDVSFSKYGDYWRKIRRISVVHLLSHKRVQSLSSVRKEEVALLVEQIKSAANDNKTVNMTELVITMTNDVTCRAAFGRKYSGGDGKKVKALFAEFTSVVGFFPVKDFIPWLGWVDKLSGLEGKVEGIAKRMDEFFEKALEEHSRRGDEDERKNSFVEVLLSLDAEDKKSIDMDYNDFIKAQILDMFAAGTDTTYTAIEWVLAELVKHPTKMKKVQKEVRKIVGSTKEVIDEEVTQSMPYFKAVIKEALRLHPPIALLVPHETTEDVVIRNYLIPSKTRLIINAWAIGRDPKAWDNPEEFLPERFLDSNIDFRGQDFQLIPFGAGRRACPGIVFAIAIVELVLVNLLYHFDWDFLGEELDMTESFGVAVHKKFSLFLAPKLRNF